MTPVEVHHEVTGPADGPVVVLLNSLGTTLAMWDAQVDTLAREFRLVRVDTRGHGLSPVPAGPYRIDDLSDDVVALLDRLDVQRAHLIGLSLGGMVALRLAARDPGRVCSVVALCTSARLEPSSAWEDRAALVRARGMEAVADAVLERWYTSDFLCTETARVQAARAMLTSTPKEGYASCCEVIATMDLRPDLAGITAPVLAIAGAEDPATPPVHLERIARGVANGRLEVIPNAAHLANDEQPALVTDRILNHVRAQCAVER